MSLSPAGDAGTHRRRRVSGALIAALAGLILLLGLVPAAAMATGGNPLQIVSTESIDTRLKEWTLSTPAVPGDTKVRILLPDGYASHPWKRYPVLYLLHGASQNYASWTDAMQAREKTAPYDMIVVMPDSGPAGGYVDWFNDGNGGPPQWETYHVEQLVPLIDEELRTKPLRRARAVAGVSMGGYGAWVYAARHPDTFVAAHSFSGPVDGTFPPLVPLVGDGPAFGPFATNAVFWHGHNPKDLAENMNGLDLVLRVGNGQPGPFDDASTPPELFGLEALLNAVNHATSAHLDGIGVDHVLDDYGPGSHLPPYAAFALERSLPEIEATFDDPPARPSKVTFKAIESEYEAYGWKVSLDRAVTEFSSLEQADRHGFEFVGSGSATVKTPKLTYLPLSLHLVKTVSQGTTTYRIRQANLKGQLTIPFEIGPDNAHQQYTPEEQASPSTFHRVKVTVY